MTTATPAPAAPEATRTRTYKSHSRPWWQRTFLTREWAIIALLVIVWFYARGEVAHFNTPLTTFYISQNVAEYMLIALPMAGIIITGEIDLSVASIVGLSSVMVGILHDNAHMSIPLAGLLALLVGVVCGAINGFLVAYVGLPSLAVTIGTQALFRGIAVGALGTTDRTDFPEKWVDRAAVDHLWGSNFPLIVVPIVVLIAIFTYLLHFSRFGRGVFEIGLNPEAAQFTGVNVQRTKLTLFTLAGVVSAFAGIFITLEFGTARGDNATGDELTIIAAVLLGGVSIFGGRGSLLGVVPGVLLIGVITHALQLENKTVNVINIVVGCLLVLSVMSTSVLAWLSHSSRRVGLGIPRRRQAVAK
jgi:rhamnose transport system permease protein